MMRMHRVSCCGLLAVASLLVISYAVSRAADDKDNKSALETDAGGWVSLHSDKDLSGWQRVPIPPGSKLSDKNPWRVDAKANLLLCDGAGVHEMLLYDKELADGIFHAEWRFRPVEGGKGYNSGVYVRSSADGKIWHQAQVGNRNVGYIFGDTADEGHLKRIKVGGTGPQRGKEAGEWNTYEMTCKGKELTLWINGAVTAEWKECPVPKGYIGLEAEGWFIEFRNLKFKPFGNARSK